MIRSIRQNASSLPLFVSLVIIAVHADYGLRDRRKSLIALLTTTPSAVMSADSLSDAIARFHVHGTNSALGCAYGVLAAFGIARGKLAAEQGAPDAPTVRTAKSHANTKWRCTKSDDNRCPSKVTPLLAEPLCCA